MSFIIIIKKHFNLTWSLNSLFRWQPCRRFTRTLPTPSGTEPEPESPFAQYLLLPALSAQWSTIYSSRIRYGPRQISRYNPIKFSMTPTLLILCPSSFTLYFSRLSTASIVLGIPTVKRESQSYLLPTLQSLVESMNEEEKNASLIIVFVAEVRFFFLLDRLF